MIPVHAADGEEVFPFGPEERFSLGPGFGMEEGARNVIQLGIYQRDRNRWDPKQGKRKGEETSNPMVNTKRAKRKQLHQPPTSKNSPRTSNMHCGINCSLVFSLILSSVVFRRHYGSTPSFVVSRSSAGLAYRLLVFDPLDLYAPQKEEKHGRAGEAGLALSLMLRR